MGGQHVKKNLLLDLFISYLFEVDSELPVWYQSVGKSGTDSRAMKKKEIKLSFLLSENVVSFLSPSLKKKLAVSVHFCYQNVKEENPGLLLTACVPGRSS